MSELQPVLPAVPVGGVRGRQCTPLQGGSSPAPFPLRPDARPLLAETWRLPADDEFVTYFFLGVLSVRHRRKVLTLGTTAVSIRIKSLLWWDGIDDRGGGGQKGEGVYLP